MDHDSWNKTWTRYQEFNQEKLIRIYDCLSIENIQRDANILDIGCGTGDFIKILKKRGFKSVHGIEPQSDLVKNSGLDCIVQGSCLSAPTIESTYDIVILLGVLHHLKSIEEVTNALINIKKLLKPGGRFYSVEPRKTFIRSFLTQLMFALPMRVLPERVKLDRVLVKEELIELNNWLNYEKDVPAKAALLGFQIKIQKVDWRMTAQILTKPEDSA